jgi:hypothetical protein
LKTSITRIVIFLVCVLVALWSLSHLPGKTQTLTNPYTTVYCKMCMRTVSEPGHSFAFYDANREFTTCTGELYRALVKNVSGTLCVVEDGERFCREIKNPPQQLTEQDGGQRSKN